jgi:RNA polymerase sigma-70 factor (ECF subfamily)
VVNKDDEQQLVDLMTRYQQGDAEAFTGLYHVLRAPLERYLWTFVRNSTTAEDLAQEAFLQIHRARHTYASPRPVRPWVYAISRHVALMHLRSGRRRKESLAPEDLPEVPVPPEMDRLGDSATLFTLMARLPKASQEVLTLHHLLGLSFQEVGDILGLAAGTAKVRAHRALKALKNMVTTEGGSDVDAART